MKIFVAGIATETNTFCPFPTALEDFSITREGDMKETPASKGNFDSCTVWREQARARGDEFVFSLKAWAEPAGPTLRAAYETLRDEVLRDLSAANPVDIVLLALHGAMVAQGYPDCEEDFIRRVRSVTGPDAVIGAEFDLHCHLSEAKIAAADLIVTYKEYPHTDILDRARELFTLAVATRLRQLRPCMALFDCRMVGRYPTSRQPMRGFVDAMIEGEKRPNVLSISFGHGFQFADVPHVGAKMLVITDNSPSLAVEVAREFGLRAYYLRREIGWESFALPMDQAFSRALVSTKTPVVLADLSDNPGGGAPGDATFALSWLLEHGIQGAALALLYDPEVTRLARRAGRGATLSLRIGGKLGATSGAPVDIEATVLSNRECYYQAFPQAGAEAQQIDSGDLVSLRSTGIEIIVTNKRCQCFSPRVFSDLGIDPKAKRLLVVKSAQHFHAAFAPLAAEVLYMAAPGALTADPTRIPYRQVNTGRLYPWIDNPFQPT